MLLKSIFYSIFSLINITLCILVIITGIEKSIPVFLFLTIISLFCATAYLSIMSYYYIRLYCNKKNFEMTQQISSGKFYIFVKDKLYKFVFTTSFTVTFLYWTLLLGGDEVMTLIKPLINNIYVHFIISLVLMVDLLTTDRKSPEGKFVIDYLLMFVFYIVYTIILTVVTKTMGLEMMYPFLYLDIPKIILINLYNILINFNTYQGIHFYSVYRRKNNDGDQSMMTMYTKHDENQKV